jgi:hypothetical protein
MRTVLGDENNVFASAEVGRSVCATHDLENPKLLWLLLVVATRV